MTTTGFEKRIAEAAPWLSRGKVQRLALKITKRAAAMQAEFDFFEQLRILGITSDPTARDAVRNVEGAAA